MERYKAVKKTVFLMWDESHQDFFYNGPEWLIFEDQAEAEKCVSEMNQLVKNLAKPQPYNGIGRPPKSAHYRRNHY